MAKAKILDDKIVITSEVLTDENLERVSVLAPSILKLRDEDETILFEIASNTVNTFTSYGACFKDGRSVSVVPESLMAIEDKETRERKIKTVLAGILTKIGMLEGDVECYLETAPDTDAEVEFMD